MPPKIKYLMLFVDLTVRKSLVFSGVKRVEAFSWLLEECYLK